MKLILLSDIPSGMRIVRFRIGGMGFDFVICIIILFGGCGMSLGSYMLIFWNRDTLLDRTAIMDKMKIQKPWNMTYAERGEAGVK
jgi:hypothetical protein